MKRRTSAGGSQVCNLRYESTCILHCQYVQMLMTHELIYLNIFFISFYYFIILIIIFVTGLVIIFVTGLYAEYKHDRTIKGNQVFMTTNLINGWFRDIDAARKDAFCSACVLSDKADDADQFIKMVWLIKGQELPKSLKEQELNIPLSDNCDFKKLDYSNPDDKKIIEDMLLWSDEIMGKKFHEGKLFK